MPDCAARIGVPAGTAMSTPACRRPQRMPKGETIGPLTGQTRPPAPGRIGPAAPGAEPFWAAASCDWTRAFAASSSRRSPSRCLRLSRVLASAEALSERTAANGRGGRRAARDGRDLVAPRLDRGGDLGLALLELVEVVGGARRLGAGGADAVDDARVLVRHALHELRAIEQVGEAVREHHGHDVGLVGLVELDQAAASATRASASRGFSRARRMRSWRSSSWMRASSARLASRSAWIRTCLRCSTVMSDCNAPILLL